MTDIVKRLKAHKADIWNWNGAAMTAWDSWRTAIASGDKSSWPRDAFESLIGAYGEDMGEAADEIARLKAEVARKDAALKSAIEVADEALSCVSRYDAQIINVGAKLEKARAAITTQEKTDV